MSLLILVALSCILCNGNVAPEHEQLGRCLLNLLLFSLLSQISYQILVHHGGILIAWAAVFRTLLLILIGFSLRDCSYR